MDNKTVSKIVLVCIVGFLSFDLLTKIIHVFDINGFRRYSAIPKALFEIFLIAVLIKNYKLAKSYVWLILSLVVITALGFIFSNEDFFKVWDRIYILNKYLYSFIFASVFFCFDNEKQQVIVITVFKAFIAIGIINSLSMIFGLVTGLDILRSYAHTERFGFNGIFLKHSETSYIYIIIIIATYYNFIQTKKKAMGLLLLFFIMTSLLIGTKAVWLMIILLIVIHFLLHQNKMIKNASRLAMVIFVTAIIIFYRSLEKLVINAFSFGPDVYDEHGFMAVLTSTRSVLLESTLEYLSKNGSFINFLIGGIDLRDYGVEFEIIDLLLFFGIIGFIVFSTLVYITYFNKPSSRLKITLFIILIIVVSLAGNFFTSIMCSIFALLMFQKMKPFEKEAII